MKSKILFISLAVVLALSLGLAGCTGSSVTPWPTNAPQGTLVIARPSLSTQTLLPWTGGAIEKNYLSGTIYESLTMRDRNANVTPCIASSWSCSTNASVWNFTIRQGIPFHDKYGVHYGNLTAADVKYTFERIASNGHNTDPSYAVSLSHIAGGLQGDLGSNISAAIQVINNATISFSLNHSDIAFPMLYTGPDMMGVVCKAYCQAHSDTVANANPVGTGPYVLDSQQIDQYIQLQVAAFAGDNWTTHWRYSSLTASDPTKYFRYIKFAIVPDEVIRATGLVNGDYQMIETIPTEVPLITNSSDCAVYPDITAVTATDIVRMGGLDQLDTYAHVPADNVSRYNPLCPWADPGNSGVAIPANSTMYTYFPGQNYTKGTLVRQALNYAVNKTAMIATIYEGAGSVAVGDLGIAQWVSTETPYPYAPATASSLLNSAGYSGGFNVTLINDGRYSNALVALAVQSYWNAIGVNTTIFTTDWATLGARWMMGGNTTNNLAGTLNGINYAWCHRTPPSSGDPTLAINMAFDPGASKGDYSESTCDGLRTAMIATVDPASRNAAIIALGAYLHQQCSQVFLVNTATPMGVRTILAEPVNSFDLKENPELIHRI